MDAKIEDRVIRILRKELGIRTRKPINRDSSLVHDLGVEEISYNNILEQINHCLNTNIDYDSAMTAIKKDTVGSLVDYVKENLEKDSRIEYKK